MKVSSAATQADGTYTLAGLFPTSYYLQFSATGFKPSGTRTRPPGRREAGAAPRRGSTTGINAVITGKPASISGSVDPGDTLKNVTTKVTARPLNLTAAARSPSR